MASFTDITPQFNPYIAQLPVEAMVSVGMEKQRRYDEGVQRIQSQIEKVAGLSVLRPVDKQYLQSKLNQLGNNLKGVAAADFSNFQLVNSVGGMVGQIAKDRYIQSAVNSTAKIKKQQEIIEEFKKKGESDKNNEDFFNEKFVRPYLESGLSDAEGNPVEFNGSYTPYVNIMKLVQDEAKTAGVDTSILQQMYKTDDQGRLMIDEKTGLPVAARTMTELETSTNAKQIEAIVNNVLKRGDVQSQLNIDGWANTRFTPVGLIAQVYKKEYDKNIGEVDADILEINTLLTGKMDGKEKEMLENKLKTYQQLKEKYKSQYGNLESLIERDPEGFKQNYYKTTFENNLSEAFIKTERKVKNLESPLKKQLNWEAEYEFKEKKEAFDQGIARQNLAINQSNAEVQRLKFLAEYEYDQSTGKWSKKPETKNLGEGDDYDDGLTADVSGEEDRSATQRFESGLFRIQNDNKDIGMDLMYNYLYKLNKGLAKDGSVYTKANAVRDIETWSKANNESPDQFLNRWILNLDNKATENGVSLGVSDRQKIEKFRQNHNDYSNLIATSKVADAKAYKETGVNIEEITKNLKPVNVKLKDGRSTTVTKQDMLDYILWEKNDDKEALNRLNLKYGKIEDFPLYNPKLIRPGGVSETITPEEYKKREVLIDNSNINSIKVLNFDKLKEANRIKNDFLAKGVHTEQSFSIAPKTNEQMTSLKIKVNSFLANNIQISGKDYDQSTALTALTKPNSKVSIRVNAPYEPGQEWTGSITITDDDGTIMQANIPNQKDLERITRKKFNPYSMNTLAVRATASPFGSTNLGTFTTDMRAWETAAIKPDNFVSLKNSKKYIPLGADLNIVDGGYTVTGYFKNSKTGEVLKPIEFEGIYKSTQRAVSDLGSLTESIIDKKLQ